MEQPRVKYDDIESYSEAGFTGAWTGRARGMWGIAALGLAAGAVVGLIAPLFTLAAPEITLGATTVLKSVAIFSAVGMATGFAVGAITGTVGGAAASVAKEAERRERQHELELGIPLPAKMQNLPEQAEARTPPSKISLSEKYFNPRTGLLFSALGAVGGLVMSAAYWAIGGYENGATAATDFPGFHALLDGAAHTASVGTAYFTGLMTTFGAMFGVNFPIIANDLQDYTGKLLSGAPLGRTWWPSHQQFIDHAQDVNIKKAPPSPPALLTQQEELPALPLPAHTESADRTMTPATERYFAARQQPSFSLQQLIAEREGRNFLEQDATASRLR